MDLLILDADGVFMNELPYWKTALATALCWHGLPLRRAEAWDAFSGTCFDHDGVQIVTKGRGCNSNWDMAAVMIRALEPAGPREAVASALTQGDWRSAASRLGAEMEAQWRNGASVPHPPVAGFGIDRQGEFFRRVVDRYQEIFFERERIEWPFARHELAAPRETLRSVFGELRRRGFALGICTSRERVEVDPPMTELGIFDCFDAAYIVTHDETMEAQRISGVRPLQKPHWFPLVCAIAGFDATMNALRDPGVLARLPLGGERIFVGDTTADFGAACAAVRMGFAVDYLHIDSRVTSAATLAEIYRHEITLGMASDLASALPLLVR